MKAVVVAKVLGGNASTSGASFSGKVVLSPTSTLLVQSKDKGARRIGIGIGVGIGVGFPIMFPLGMAMSAFVAKRRGVKMGISVELYNENVNEL